MEKLDNNEKRSWRSQRLDEAPFAPQEGEQEVEFEELAAPEPRRTRFGSDTPLDVEVVRVQRNDFDTDLTEPDAGEPETRAEGEEQGQQQGEQGQEESRNPARERFRLVRQLVLGTILNTDSMRENYRYAVLIAVMLFLSIAMLFSSLGSYLRYAKLENEVRLLRERAIRMSEQRYEHSSHSAIVRQLNERGINLVDPQEPHELLD